MSASAVRVPIIGATGDLGFGLAVRWSLAGVAVTIRSRSAERARTAAARVRELVPDAGVEGVENVDAARAGDVVVLAVPFAAQLSTLGAIASALSPGTILVDCAVPLATAVGGRPTEVLGLWRGSAAEQAQAAVPAGVTVVGALHSLSAAVLADLGQPLDEDVLLCGRRRADKRRVARLLQLIPGLPLDAARSAEQLTALLISINGRYKTHAGIRILRLPEDDHWAEERAAG
jgi:8-hydroxy-5-deazaflavin:NADPH oxidoreductase